MSQVSSQQSPHCDAPHGAPSAATGPGLDTCGLQLLLEQRPCTLGLQAPKADEAGEESPGAAIGTPTDPQQTPSLLPGLEVVTASTRPAEAAPEEGSLEEAAHLVPQGNGPGAHPALGSTDFDVPTEAVTRQPQGNPLGCTPLLPNGSGHPSELGGARRAGNGALGGPKAHRKLQAHPSLASQGSRKSKGSTKSAASQIPIQAQEDCCVHCILSCLFCEFLTLCNIVLDCATCGSCSSEDSCLCCCCCGSGECADCDLPCDLDCGILDACCESADCLEICMECCGLCFSS